MSITLVASVAGSRWNAPAHDPLAATPPATPAQPVPSRGGLTLRAAGLSATVGADGATRLAGPGSAELVIRPHQAPLGPLRLGGCVDPARLDAEGACLRRVESPLPSAVAWWDSAEGGVRQGWTVASIPADGKIRVEADVDGAVTLLDDGIGVGAAGVGWRGHDLRAWDASGRDLKVQTELTASGFALVVDAEGAVPPIEIDPTWEPWSWRVEGMTPRGRFANLVRGIGDMNADGFSDVALTFGADDRSPEFISVYAGGPAGLATTAAAPLPMGARVDAMDAGDLNGDGHPDLAALAASTVSIWFGGTAFPFGSPPLTLQAETADRRLGTKMAVAPDLNGDGFDDLIVNDTRYPSRSPEGVRVYLGGPSGPSPAAYQFIAVPQAVELTGVGDMDGDGFGEVAIGEPEWVDPAFSGETGWWGQQPAGRVRLFRGSAGGLMPTAAEWGTDVSGENFGATVGRAGDVNGDGLGDLLVRTAGSPNAVDLFLGVAGGVPSTRAQRWRGASGYSCFGCELQPAGDYNGDGFDDVLIGYPSYSLTGSGEGRALLFYGGPSGPPATHDESWESAEYSAQLGSSLGGAGDVNADGLDDLIFGAPGYGFNAARLGMATAALGRATPAPELPAPALNHVISEVLVGVGDAHGDGFDDLLIGKHLYAGSATGLTSLSVRLPLSYPYSNEVSDAAGDVNGDGLADMICGETGTAWVLASTAGGGAPTLLHTWEGDYQVGESSLGESVAGVGDVDADGFDDVAIAIPTDWWGHDNSRVWIVHGATTGIETTPRTILRAPHPEAYWGNTLDAAGDVNGDGFADVLIGGYGLGRDTIEFGRVFLGGAAGVSYTPLPLTLPDAPYYPGFVVQRAGDVNGDHYDDVLVAAIDHVGSLVGVFHGGPMGPGATPNTTLHEPNPGSNFGLLLAPVGDMNGDGYDDVLVVLDAEPFRDGVAAGARVVGYWGGPNGLTDAPSWGSPPWMIPADGLQSVAGAGDVNGDGFDDFVIGVRAVPDALDDDPWITPQAVYLFYGGPSGPSLTPSGVQHPSIAPLEAATVTEGATLSLSAEARYGGPDPLSLTWDFGDGGPTASGATVSHAWADDGDYIVVVTASAGGESTSASTVVQVTNADPTLIDAPHARGRQGVPVRLTATATDVPGDPLLYTWEILGSVVGTGQALDHTFPVVGTYGIHLTVTDDDGGRTEATQLAFIEPNLRIDVPPLAVGTPATIRVRGATPGARVVLLASPRPGAGPSCAPSGAPCVDLNGAVVTGTLTANPTGAGAVTIPIPPTVPPGATLRFQAIELDSQSRSPVASGRVSP